MNKKKAVRRAPNEKLPQPLRCDYGSKSMEYFSLLFDTYLIRVLDTD